MLILAVFIVAKLKKKMQRGQINDNENGDKA